MAKKATSKAARKVISAAGLSPQEIVKQLQVAQARLSEFESRYAKLSRQYEKLKVQSKAQRQQIKSLKGQVLAQRERVTQLKSTVKVQRRRVAAANAATKEAQKAKRAAEKALKAASKVSRELWLEQNKMNFIEQFIKRTEAHYGSDWKSEYSANWRIHMAQKTQKELYLGLKEAGSNITATMYESDAAYSDMLDISTADMFYTYINDLLGIPYDQKIREAVNAINMR